MCQSEVKLPHSQTVKSDLLTVTTGRRKLLFMDNPKQEMLKRLTLDELEDLRSRPLKVRPEVKRLARKRLLETLAELDKLRQEHSKVEDLSAKFSQLSLEQRRIVSDLLDQLLQKNK